MKSLLLKTAVTAVLMSMTAVAFGAPGGGKGPPADKGNKPDTEVSSNLSVPAIMAGGQGSFGVDCSSDAFTDLLSPDKPPVYYDESTGASEDGGMVVRDAGWYYVQRDAAWQAPCFTATSTPVTVNGKWGDNLAGGSASLKVGSPIRVEFVLLDGAGVAAGQDGYFVIKLEPSELDRESDYGHLALTDSIETPSYFEPITYTVGDTLPDGGNFAAVVFDPTATLRIERMVDGVPVSPAVYNGTAGAEINATGKIVYGYNLRVQVAGTYRITYSFNQVEFADDCNAGSCAGSVAYLDINIVGGGGGGGKK